MGSGPGWTTDWLVPRVGHLTALEYDPADAAALAARLDHIDAVHGDATTMPFPADGYRAPRDRPTAGAHENAESAQYIFDRGSAGYGRVSHPW